MSDYRIKSTDTTTVVRDDIEPGYAVICDATFAGRERGTVWELHRIERTTTDDGREDFAVYGFKLTKKGTRLSAVPHLLWWLHDDEDVLASHNASTFSPQAAALRKAVR